MGDGEEVVEQWVVSENRDGKRDLVSMSMFVLLNDDEDDSVVEPKGDSLNVLGLDLFPSRDRF